MNPDRLRLLLALVFLSFSSANASPDPTEQIARVESGLLPPAIIARAGAKPATWTLAERMAFHHVPGLSIAVIDQGEIAWARGYGVLRAGESATVTPETPFQAASISKTIAAATTLTLVDAGRVSLDADANSLLTTWKIPASPVADGEPVTLRRLLSHTAGLSVHGFVGYSAGESLPTLPQMLDGTPPANSAAVRLLKRPGSLWLYSGGGFVVLQQLLTDVTGESFAALARTRVLLPTGMTASTFEQPLRSALTTQAATGHDAAAQPLHGDAHIYPELAAAGLWTTPTDLARFLLALGHDLAGTGQPSLLSPTTAAAMVTVPLEGSDYALGLGVKNPGPELQLNHSGANAGFRALYIYYPRLGRGAVLMTNADSGAQLIPEILRALAREYDWPDYRVAEKTAVDLAPEDFDTFAGRYERDDTVLVFYRKDDHFYLRATNTARVEVFPQSDHTFFTLSSDAVYEFGRDDLGHVTHVIRRDGTSRQLFPRVN